MQNRNNLKSLGVCAAAHLECLPTPMASLTSLKILELHEAVLVQSLPELPASWRSYKSLNVTLRWTEDARKEEVVTGTRSHTSHACRS
jgi:hypothetical protein